MHGSTCVWCTMYPIRHGAYAAHVHTHAYITMHAYSSVQARFSRTHARNGARCRRRSVGRPFLMRAARTCARERVSLGMQRAAPIHTMRARSLARAVVERPFEGQGSRLSCRYSARARHGHCTAFYYLYRYVRAVWTRLSSTPRANNENEARNCSFCVNFRYEINVE